MGTAVLIAADIGGYAGVANVYRLSPPLDNYPFVTVFACDFPGSQHDETTIVGATPDGAAVLMNRLPGSLVGFADHAKALELAGYEVDNSQYQPPVQSVDAEVVDETPAVDPDVAEPGAAE